MTTRTAAEVIQMAQDNNIDMIDLKFVDVPGTMQHLTIPTVELTPELFVEGTGFDGSSIRGFQAIHESDMLLVPDPVARLEHDQSPVAERPLVDVADRGTAWHRLEIGEPCPEFLVALVPVGESKPLGVQGAFDLLLATDMSRHDARTCRRIIHEDTPFVNNAGYYFVSS